MKTIGRVFRSAACLSSLLLLVPCALPQSKTPGPGSGNNSKGGDAPKAPPIQQQPAPNQNQPKLNLQTLYVTGMVVQEDGSPLPSGVVIERVCAGRIKKEAYVTTSGSFGFQIGGVTPSDVLPDASDDTFGVGGAFGGRTSQPGFGAPGPSSFSGPNLMGCELRAQLAGYRSSTIVLDGYTPMGNMDVGTILLKPLSQTQGSMISVTDMQAPKAAKKSLEHANKAIQKQNYPEAEKELKLALAAYPNYATAWYKLGAVYQKEQRIPDARDAFAKAIETDAKFVSPYIQLARMAGMEQKWQEVAEFTDKAVALDSLDFPEGYYLNSVAYYFMGKLDFAERSVRKAQRLDPLHRLPKANILLADILEQKHDFAGSMEQLQAYLKFTPLPQDADAVRARIQKLEESNRAMAGNQVQKP